VLDLERCAESPLVLTADSLLVGDIGRPDFGGGDAAAQYESIMRLLGMPDWVEVFPGHYEGPCGNDMWGRASTTIGFERRYNPLAQLERDSFVTTLSRHVPARPLNMTAIEATNRGLAEMPWAMLTTAPTVPEITIDELAARLPDVYLLDVREPAEYARGHIPGAINLPQAELASRLDEVPHDQPIFVVCRSGERSRRSSQFLMQVGISTPVNVAGGTSAWAKAGQPLERLERTE
jgi:rhodanese-related sulfurtransferase